LASHYRPASPRGAAAAAGNSANTGGEVNFS